MDVSRPYTAICPTLDSEVLATLARTTRPLTGREVARLAGRRSHAGVLEVLNRLSEHGLVDREEAGKAFLFTLNRNHLAAPAVDVLAGMRTELLKRLRDSIQAWQVAPRHVSLFGSAARGEGDTQSDIDLFIVRPKGVPEDDARWRTQLEGLAAEIRSWTGNHASFSDVSEDELRRLRSDAPPILDELRADAIVLSGAETQELLATA
jgi:predicted nucleotidyltransferase